MKKLEQILNDERIPADLKKKLTEVLDEINEDRFRVLTDNLPGAIFEADTSMNVTYGNKKSFEIFGYTEEDLQKGIHGLQTLVPEDRKRALENIQNRAKGVDIGRIEYTGLRKDGTTFPILFHSEPIIKNNEIVGLRGFIVDITELKTAEKILIQNERLSAIAELASGTAHDINNKLQGIIGNIELALYDLPDSEVKEYLTEALQLGINASSTVKKLQDFAKIAPKEISDYELIDISEVVETAINETKYLWKEQSKRYGINIEIKKELQHNLTVKGDKVGLENVLHNIIKNSVEAMPKGGTIKVIAKQKEDNIYITINDSGKGMDENTAKKAFMPFFTTKGHNKGSGLGLASCYALIKNHSGEIYITDSNPKSGTTFEIKLPFIEKTKQYNNENSIDENFRILWVDDEEHIRTFGQRIYRKEGYFIDVAASGQEALELLSRNKYNLMITDIGMDKMNGWELTQKVKSQYELVVAILSGWGNEFETHKKEECGADYIYTKPIRKNELIDLASKVKNLKK